MEVGTLSTGKGTGALSTCILDGQKDKWSMRALGQVLRGSSPLWFCLVDELLPHLSHKRFLALEAQECNRQHMGSEAPGVPLGQAGFLPAPLPFPAGAGGMPSHPFQTVLASMRGLLPSSHHTDKEPVEGL